jgi:Domain of unknown function (DUF305)
MPRHRLMPIAALCAMAGFLAGSISDVGLRAEEQGEHAGHDMKAAAPAGAQTDATKAFEEAMMKMHKDMTVPYTGDVDLDFVRGMIPHHQGAIDQAQILLKYSKNLRLRRLAGGIIAAQKREITFMKYWLDEHEKGVESNEMPVWLRADPTDVEKPDAPAAKPAPENDGAGKK